MIFLGEELTGGAIVVSEHNRYVSERSSQHSCKMMGVSLVRLYQGAGLCPGSRMEEVSIRTCPPSSTKRAKKGGSGQGGLSVLEKSHVVSQSCQLLLVRNQ